MKQETKDKAMLKLSTFTYKIGFPDKWIDYSNLNGKLSRHAPYLTNLRKATAVNFHRDITEANKPTDKTKWHMAPFVVNAYFNPPCNEIVFPAAILQPPMYYPISAEEPLGQPALSFGGIGGVIAHEVSHAFDDQGRKYDHKGNLNDWWQKADSMHYDERAAKIVAQFNKFKILGKNVNGKLTQGENIADLGGVSVSYNAFVSYLQEKSPKLSEIEGFSQEQQFFISWAQIWRNLIRDEALEQRLVTDPHSPGEFRVDGPLSNVSAFHRAFG